MKLEDWVTEAVNATHHGASLRDVQRYIDEHHHEELSVKTLGDALDAMVEKGKLEVDNERYFPVKKTNKEDALKQLFGDE